MRVSYGYKQWLTRPTPSAPLPFFCPLAEPIEHAAKCFGRVSEHLSNMPGEFIKLVGFSSTSCSPSATAPPSRTLFLLLLLLISRLPLCAISLSCCIRLTFWLPVVDFSCSFCQMTFLFLQVTHTKPQRISYMCMCYPLPHCLPLSRCRLPLMWRTFFG